MAIYLSAETCPLPQNLSHLEYDYSGIVECLPKGTHLFHRFHNPASLTTASEFDKQYAQHGGFFFSSHPTPWTNCAVELLDTLVMFKFPDITETQRKQLGEGFPDNNYWLGAQAVGFDGRTYRTEERICETITGEYGTEIVVFVGSLQKLGQIAAWSIA